MAATRAYLDMWPGLSSDKLFPAYGVKDDSTKGISADAVSTIVKTAAEAAGVDGRFTGHSLRIGGATAAAQSGATVEQIRARGDWTSEAVWLYIRAVAAAHAGLSAKMGL